MNAQEKVTARTVERMNAELASAQHTVHKLHSEINLLRGELAGYKLAVRLLGRLGKLTAGFCGYIGRIQATYK